MSTHHHPNPQNLDQHHHPVRVGGGRREGRGERDKGIMGKGPKSKGKGPRCKVEGSVREKEKRGEGGSKRQGGKGKKPGAGLGFGG